MPFASLMVGVRQQMMFNSYRAQAVFGQDERQNMTVRVVTPFDRIQVTAFFI